jgi:hypothetical protein
MKKFIWAGLLALPLAVCPASTARADGPIVSWVFQLKGQFNTGIVPGPWYTYWPGGGCDNRMTSAYANDCWTYEMNFQTPAPMFPYWPPSQTPNTYLSSPGSPTFYPNMGYQPAGYYPSYWYGR